ncbi:MAG: hypothetical protein L6420_04070 [Elusimicrobia bacterium]|nr:hypothetical protein [Elusimicrobiota bacterium]
MKKLLLSLLCAVFFVGGAFASDEGHPDREFLTGSGFEFVKVNDVLVGTFNLIPIWAEKACGDHIKGFYKVGKDVKEFSVIIKDGKLTGTFGKRVIVVEGVDPQKKEITLTSGGNKFIFKYNNGGTNGAHLVNLQFDFQGIDQNNYNVTLDGECCLGSVMFYSVFITGVTSL